MTTVIEALRQILGVPDFYVTTGATPYWDYSAMIEYFVGALILLVVVASVFRFLSKAVFR